MKITYNRILKYLIIDGNDDLLIISKDGVAFDVNGLYEFYDDSGIRLKIKNMFVVGRKPTLKEKLIEIVKIIKL